MIQKLVRLEGSQAFVDEMEDEAGMRWREKFAQCRCEASRFFRLRAGSSIRMERIADEHDFYPVLTDEARCGFQVRTQRRAAEGEEWLSGDAEGIGDGDADAAIANVQRKCAWMGHKTEFRPPQRPTKKGRQIVGPFLESENPAGAATGSCMRSSIP